MINEGNPIELRIESAVVLGSLARGTEDNIRGLIEAGAISVLLKGRLMSDRENMNNDVLCHLCFG